MRRASLIAAALGGILVVCSASDALAQSSSGGSRRSGWYVGGGAGANWASDIEQKGFNRDPLCYPTDACFDEEPRPEFPGYRWAYDLDSAAGAVFELSAGYVLGRARLELSFGQRKNDVDQIFSGVTTFDGIALEDRRASTVTSNTQSSIDNLAVRTLAVNAYYDFRNAATGFSPYVGAGVGPAFVDIRGVRFSDEYFDTAGNGAAYDPPLSSYTASLDADFSDTVLAAHVHAGTEFGLNDRTALGVKLTYSVLGDVEYTGMYDQHAAHSFDPDFTHTDTFTAARYWSLLFTVRYVIGG